MISTDAWEMVGAVLFSLGGAAVLVAGLSGWLGRLWAQRILEQEGHERARALEALKADIGQALEQSKAALAAAQARESAELQHRAHVSKAQFDLEFKLYQDLWTRIENLRASAIRYWVPLKDTLAGGPLSPAQIAAAIQGQQVITDLYQSFVEHHLSQSPFIAQSVKAWLDDNAHVLAAINGVSKMALEAAMHHRPQDFDVVGEAQSQINAAQLTFADAIRERLASVAIIV